ncbi:MAG TPA: DUF2062 domain-containing protein [Cellvibrionaceae bacterium]
MARKLFRRFLPSAHTVKNQPGLQFLGALLHDPNLFHLNRHSVSLACFVGIFLAFMPVPAQMLLAALCALWIRCNLPIAMGLVWISNPLTITPMFYTSYRLGRRLLDAPGVSLPSEPSWTWLFSELGHLWKPLLAGSVVLGLLCGGFAYIAMQFFWRWQVMKNWEKRKRDRLIKRSDTHS